MSSFCSCGGQQGPPLGVQRPSPAEVFPSDPASVRGSKKLVMPVVCVGINVPEEEAQNTG